MTHLFVLGFHTKSRLDILKIVAVMWEKLPAGKGAFGFLNIFLFMDTVPVRHKKSENVRNLISLMQMGNAEKSWNFQALCIFRN